MTFFSRCDVPQRYDASLRKPRRRQASRRMQPLSALAGLLEDLGILFRYGAGLDYYGRHRLQTKE